MDGPGEKCYAYDGSTVRNEPNRTLRHLILGARLLLCLWGPGCGGIVKYSEGVDGGDGSGTGEATGAAGAPSDVGGGSKAAGGSKASGGKPAKATCGNGVIDSGEICDG